MSYSILMGEVCSCLSKVLGLPPSKVAVILCPVCANKLVDEHINGQPAILIFGRLAPNSAENPQAQRQWDETLGLQLSWSLKDSIYTLETLGSYVSADDLIRMAESRKIASGETTTP